MAERGKRVVRKGQRRSPKSSGQEPMEEDSIVLLNDSVAAAGNGTDKRAFHWVDDDWRTTRVRDCPRIAALLQMANEGTAALIAQADRFASTVTPMSAARQQGNGFYPAPHKLVPKAVREDQVHRYKIEPDGSCFYRSLAVALTGHQENHDFVRDLVGFGLGARWVWECPQDPDGADESSSRAAACGRGLANRCDFPLPEWLDKQRAPFEWADQTALFAAATLLQTPIVTLKELQPDSGVLQWLLIQPVSALPGVVLPKEENCAIYIANLHDHFEPIIDVTEDEIDLAGSDTGAQDAPITITSGTTGSGAPSTTSAAASPHTTTGAHNTGPSSRTRSKTAAAQNTTGAQSTAPLRKRSSAERLAVTDSKKPRLAAGDQPGVSGTQPQHQAPSTPPPYSDPGALAFASAPQSPIPDPGSPVHASTPVQLQHAVPDFFQELFGLEASAEEVSSPSEPSPTPDESDEDWEEPPLEEQMPHGGHELRQWLLDTMTQATIVLRDTLRQHNGRARDDHVRDAVADWCAVMAQLVPLSGGFVHRLGDHEGWLELHRGVFIVTFGVMVNEASAEIVQSRLAVLRRAVYDHFGVAAGSRPMLGRWVNQNVAALRADWHPPAPVPDNPVAAPAQPAGPFVDMGQSPPATPPSDQPLSVSAASGDSSGLSGGSSGPDEVFEPVAGPLAAAIANHMGRIELAPPPLPVAPAPGLAPGRPLTRAIMRQHPDRVWQQMSVADVWRQADAYVCALRV